MNEDEPSIDDLIGGIVKQLPNIVLVLFTEENAERISKFYGTMYKDLKKQGFTKKEAFQILLHSTETAKELSKLK